MIYLESTNVENWYKLSLVEQLANIGSEVIRALNWKQKGNKEFSQLAFYRALDLLNLTKSDTKNRLRLKEVTITYEILSDYFAFNNSYKSKANSLKNYFNQFTYLNAVRNGR